MRRQAISQSIRLPRPPASIRMTPSSSQAKLARRLRSSWSSVLADSRALRGELKMFLPIRSMSPRARKTV